MKTIALLLASLAAGSISQADDRTADQSIVTLPAYVVEASRFDAMTLDLNAYITQNSDRVLAGSRHSSERSLERLGHRLNGRVRHLARAGQPGPRRNRA